MSATAATSSFAKRSTRSYCSRRTTRIRALPVRCFAITSSGSPAITTFNTDAAFGSITDGVWSMQPTLTTSGGGVFSMIGVIPNITMTGGGTFQRLVKPFFYNTAGLKLRHPKAELGTAGEVTLAHSQFVSWAHGAEAHVQHLLAYAGTLDMSGASYLVVDPRAAFVVGRYRAATFEELSGKWAVPGENYGQELVELAEELMEPA